MCRKPILISTLGDMHTGQVSLFPLAAQWHVAIRLRLARVGAGIGSP
jgi:hypothetical protein